MQLVSYFFILAIAYPISLLPFRAVYLLSDFLYLIIFYVVGYRKKVIVTNLRNSFPEKNEKEIRAIFIAYYHYLCDLTLETVKKIRMTEKESLDRCRFHKADWMDKFYEEKKSIIIMLGHQGNWEWAGPAFTLNNRHQLVVIYRPIANPYFEKMLSGIRTKFGTRITQVNQTLRDMVANRGEITATAFLADQTASPENAYWTTFLNQDTAVFIGPEKLAKKFNYPVVYMNVKRVRRGYYEVFPELLFENPKDAAENEISEAFTRRLEREIIKDPATWLWSHRRWKHTREKKS